MFACLTYQLLSVFFSLFTLLNLNQFNFKQFYLPDMSIHVQKLQSIQWAEKYLKKMMYSE